MDRVQLSPQDVALGAECADGEFLLGTRACVLGDLGERELRVFRSLGEARVEISQAAGEPGVMLA